MKYDINALHHNVIRAKLKQLIEARYSNLPAHKQRGAFVDAYSEAYGDDLSDVIKHWLSPNGTKEPTIERLIEICELLNCDIDYFLTSQESFSMEISSVSDITGLEETTIEEITKLSIAEKHIIDALFSRTVGSFNLFKLIKEMLFYSHPDAKNNAHISLDSEITSKNKDMGELEKKLNDTEILNLLSYKLGIEMQSIIECLANDDKLTEEIYSEYKEKYFKEHLKPKSSLKLIWTC